MEIVTQSVTIGCLILLAASAIVFPILFLVQFSHFRKELSWILKETKQTLKKEEDIHDSHFHQ